MTLKATFTLDSLVQFMVEHGKSGLLVSPEESRRNLEANIVGIYELDGEPEVKDNLMYSVTPKTRGCGLRLTTDGYILTAAHVVRDMVGHFMARWAGDEVDPRYFTIIDQQKIAYLIDPTFSGFDAKFDLALIKTYNPYRGRPIPFNININEPIPGEPVSLVALDHQQLRPYKREGKIEDTRCWCIDKFHNKLWSDVFSTTSPSIRGHSGGIILDQWGSLLGTVNFGSPEEETKNVRSFSEKIKYGLELINVVLDSGLL